MLARRFVNFYTLDRVKYLLLKVQCIALNYKDDCTFYTLELDLAINFYRYALFQFKFVVEWQK